jgi:hypothetical protein
VKVLDLFAGTGSSTAAFVDAGWDRTTVELDPQHGPDIVADIADLDPADLDGPYDFVWASPPCTAFSILGAYRNWTWSEPFHAPKHKRAVDGLALFAHTRRLIEQLRPSAWLVENPVGVARKTAGVYFFSDVHRYTITYCAYGHPWRKPTDLWGVPPVGWRPRPQCATGAGCHEAKPAGNAHRTGTFGGVDAKARSVVPYELGRSLVEAYAGPVEVFGAAELPFGGAA